jgi:hypothetical protein
MPTTRKGADAWTEFRLNDVEVRAGDLGAKAV